MTTNKPEVVAWRWFKPTVNNQGETVGGIWKVDGVPSFLPWWTNEPLIRLTDYEALQAECEKLVEALEEIRDLPSVRQDEAAFIAGSALATYKANKPTENVYDYQPSVPSGC